MPRARIPSAPMTSAPMTSAAKNILLVLTAAYFVPLLIDAFTGLGVGVHMALDVRTFSAHTLYQIFTHPAASPAGSDSVFSTLLSLLCLWWILPGAHLQLGTRPLITLLLATTLSAGMVTFAVCWPLGQGMFLSGYTLFVIAIVTAVAWRLRRTHTKLALFGQLSITPQQVLWVLLIALLALGAVRKDLPDLLAHLVAMGVGICHGRHGAPKRRRKRAFRLVSANTDTNTNTNKPSRWLN